MVHKAMLEAKESNKQLCIFIDSIYDITCDLNFTNDNARLSYVAQELARLYKTHQIPIVGTGHLKKINDTRRPISDDLKDTVNLQFQASAIMLCYNEVKVKAERAEVYHIVAGLGGKQPVLEVYIDKNKLGEFHGRLFYNMYPTYSLLDPATKEAGKLYSAKIAM
jgi:replicative DNA helicase